MVNSGQWNTALSTAQSRPAEGQSKGVSGLRWLTEVDIGPIIWSYVACRLEPKLYSNCDGKSLASLIEL